MEAVATRTVSSIQKKKKSLLHELLRKNVPIFLWGPGIGKSILSMIVMVWMPL